MKRCSWVNLDNPLYVAYHDKEWGRAVHDDHVLFELLCLETYQSGLSWETVLNKRQEFRQVFHHYNIEKVAAMSDADLEIILQNPRVIRHRLKLFSARQNARSIILIQKEFGSFDRYIWSFVDNKVQVNSVNNYNDVPASTTLSERLSKDLKKRGFKFVGPTCLYSFIQAAGMVNDHENICDFK
ncbi:TPA: DNA-3-methyladenine glycosylase I [Streptococcus agalactiae]